MAEIVIRLHYRAANGKIEDAQQDYGLETFGGFLPAVGDQVLDPGAAAGRRSNRLPKSTHVDGSAARV